MNTEKQFFGEPYIFPLRSLCKGPKKPKSSICASQVSVIIPETVTFYAY